MTELAQQVRQYISQKRLFDAFATLRHMASRIGSWTVTQRIDQLQETYSMMLRYMLDDVTDPQRDEIYDSITTGITQIAETMLRDSQRDKSPNIYFSTLRYEALQNDNLAKLLADYRSHLQSISAYGIAAAGGKKPSEGTLRDIEALERRIFNKVWTSWPVSMELKATITELLAADDIPPHVKELVVSALFLAQIHSYDEHAISILLDTYTLSESRPLSIKALCAAILALFINREQATSGALHRRINVMRDTITTWSADVKTVFMELIRSRDTERINRKVNDELIPSLMKLRPDIAGKLQDTMHDFASMEDNPEWSELLEQSGITDKIRKLSKLQEDGGDVFMSTFAALKHFPFFADVANWFLPFSPSHTNVSSSIGSELRGVAQMMAASPIFCDSDKYSFLLALGSVPEEQKRMMLSQFDGQMADMAEMSGQEVANDTTVSQIANKYIQNIYRFFKLYRRKSDFSDPFAQPINLLQMPLFAIDIDDVDTLTLVGEFYFSHGYYADARLLFERLSKSIVPSHQLFQKLGQCCFKLGDTSGALDNWIHAELLNGESEWTLRHIAACYRDINQPANALDYYRRVEAINPDDLNIAMSMGHCHLNLGNFKEALRFYFKVDFYDSTQTLAVRPIAWTSFIAGEYEQAMRYYERLLNLTPTATDFLNMGHLHMALHQHREAFNCYVKSIRQNPNGINGFVEELTADTPVLVNAGVKESTISLVLDALRETQRFV